MTHEIKRPTIGYPHSGKSMKYAKSEASVVKTTANTSESMSAKGSRLKKTKVEDLSETTANSFKINTSKTENYLFGKEYLFLKKNITLREKDVDF